LSPPSAFPFWKSLKSSLSRRRPRKEYFTYILTRIKKYISKLWRYARRHPFKAIMKVIVGGMTIFGALAGLLRVFGIRNPFVEMIEKWSLDHHQQQSLRPGMDVNNNNRGLGQESNVWGTVGEVVKIAQAFM